MDLLEDIKSRGVQEPLMILDNGLVISGHRRRRHAIEADLEEVPVVVRRDISGDLEVREALILSNRMQRERTNEQIAREFKELKAIEEERAKVRQQQGRFQPGEKAGRTVRQNSDAPQKPDENGQNAKSGRSDDKAAAAVGVSRDTARKSTKVIDAIDEAEASGDKERAETLRSKLNDESVNSAFKEMSVGASGGNGKPPAKPKPDRTRQELLKDLDANIGRAIRIISKLGCKTGQGKIVYENMDVLCKAIAWWK